MSQVGVYLSGSTEYRALGTEDVISGVETDSSCELWVLKMYNKLKKLIFYRNCEWDNNTKYFTCVFSFDFYKS